ncbi:hypothetical protein DNI29_15420 [Hymenobacter sediminis]|uniref:hypothetical protein n=1 Tax=Hymenobacter sediminis TaxID=2218621 RepID=UPI000F4D69F6|nr:hypothetical protein [Hymenobacter sediminis]RPD46385.1 hypothetical protein DNI29_15420 [Hymenobacter sediminis]
MCRDLLAVIIHFTISSKNMQFESLNLTSLTESEEVSITGGEGNPYGAGANLDNIGPNIHAIGDFFRGFYNGLTGK